MWCYGARGCPGSPGKKSLKIVGAVDIDPDLVGKDLADILEIPQKTGITIKKDADALFSSVNA
jgi:hypothetical protein